jgi:hypothetical protein
VDHGLERPDLGRGRWPEIDGIDYGLCIARPDLESALVETARELGADVRERAVAKDLIWDGDRVTGVRYEVRGEDEARELRAPLVVGADGWREPRTSRARASPTTSRAFFRQSSGPGWALAGGAGHFKDPTIGQGIRDALRFGRRLGETAAPARDDPAALDRALIAWEHERDQECLSSYHWGNRESLVSPDFEVLRGEVLDQVAREQAPIFAEVVARVRRPEEVFSPKRMTKALWRALSRSAGDRRELLRLGREEVRSYVALQRERRRADFRATGGLPSERPGWTWPPQRKRSASKGKQTGHAAAA